MPRPSPRDDKSKNPRYVDFFERLHVFQRVGHLTGHQAFSLGFSSDYRQLKRSKKAFLLAPLALLEPSILFYVGASKGHDRQCWRYPRHWQYAGMEFLYLCAGGI